MSNNYRALFTNRQYKSVQHYLVKILSFSGVIWTAITFSMAFPPYGWIAGLAIGLISFYINVRYNKIVMFPEQLRASEFTRQVSTLEKCLWKICDFFCVLVYVAQIGIGSYTGYMIIGETLNWPMTQASFGKLGLVCAIVGSTGALLSLAIAFGRKWTLQDRDFETEGVFWEWATVITRFLQRINDNVIMVFAFDIAFPGNVGLVVGIIMGLACLGISTLSNYQIFIRDKKTKARDMQKRAQTTMVHTWQTNLFAASAITLTTIAAVANFIWVYIGCLTLGATLTWLAPAICMTFGIVGGVMAAIAMFIKYGSLTGRLWVDLCAAPVTRPEAIPAHEAAMMPLGDGVRARSGSWQLAPVPIAVVACGDAAAPREDTQEDGISKFMLPC